MSESIITGIKRAMIKVRRWKVKSFVSGTGIVNFKKPVSVWLTYRHVWRAYIKPFGWFCYLSDSSGTIKDIKEFVQELLGSDYRAYALEDDNRLIGHALNYKKWFLENVEESK